MNARRAVSLVLGLSLLCLVASPLLAAGEPVVPDTDAAKYVDKKVSIRGVVAGVAVSRADITYLNFGQKYPNQTFSAVIPKEQKAKFPNPKKWEGKTITVTGTVKMSRDKPQIVLEDAAQISAQ
ncbi:MAG TPA: hypothetical protein PLB02_00825 [Thermoanaerobaculia bacterium]|nr:hypothetical protein [Thermoanaerobaculia bacterium]HQR65919.1 hypothetical protein [Thermoanaerobaculia bacterium]